MLKKLADAFSERKLPYFWHTEHNLIEKIDSMAMSNYENRIKNMISKIETSLCGNNWIIAEYLCKYDTLNYLYFNDLHMFLYPSNIKITTLI